MRTVVGVLLLSVSAVTYLRFASPLFTSFMMQAKVSAILSGRPFDIEYHWVGWQRISPAAALAVVAAEDQSFPTHHGFDFREMYAAVEAGKRGHKLRGASTISQQVAKNVFLWPGRSWIRKGIEAYFTVLLEAILPKRRILEIYLNTVELAPGVYGVEAAAQRFFAKPAAQLTMDDAARLAAVLPNPQRLRIDPPSPYVRTRAARIAKAAARLGAGHLRDL